MAGATSRHRDNWLAVIHWLFSYIIEGACRHLFGDHLDIVGS